MKISFVRTFAFCASLAICATQAQAQALTGFSGGTLFATFEADGDTIGWQFSVNRAITVTHLGYWDGDAINNRITLDHPVGLWDAAGTLLTSNVVTPASPFTGDWKYEPTANVTIGPGTYHIGAFVSAANPLSDGYMTGTTGITMSPGFTMLNTLRDASGAQSGLVFPNVVTAPGGRFGPNFLFTEVVPEPASVLVLGGLCAALLRRRSRKSS
jgi:hypothetical protein